MRRFVAIGFAIAAALPALGVASIAALREMVSYGELGGKAGWAALQGVEFHARGKNCDAAEIRPAGGGDYLAFGFPGGGAKDGAAPDGSCRAWLLLNERAPDRRVKQMPRFASYRLTCGDVAKLEKTVPGIDRYALEHLRTICTPLVKRPAPH